MSHCLQQKWMWELLISISTINNLDELIDRENEIEIISELIYNAANTHHEFNTILDIERLFQNYQKIRNMISENQHLFTNFKYTYLLHSYLKPLEIYRLENIQGVIKLFFSYVEYEKPIIKNDQIRKYINQAKPVEEVSKQKELLEFRDFFLKVKDYNSEYSKLNQIHHMVKIFNLAVSYDSNLFSIYFEEDLISALQLLFMNISQFIGVLCRQKDDHEYIIKQCKPFEEVLHRGLLVMNDVMALLVARFEYKLTDKSRKELGLLRLLQEVVNLFAIVYQYQEKQEEKRLPSKNETECFYQLKKLQKHILSLFSNWSDYTDDVDNVLQFLYLNLFDSPYRRPGILLLLATYLKICNFQNEKKNIIVKTLLLSKLTNIEEWQKLNLIQLLIQNDNCIIENIVEMFLLSSSPHIIKSFVFLLQSLFGIYKNNIQMTLFNAIEKQIKEQLMMIKNNQFEKTQFPRQSYFSNLGRIIYILRQLQSNPQFISVSIFKDFCKILLQVFSALEMESNMLSQENIEQNQTQIQNLEHIKLQLIDLFAKLCLPDNGIDVIIDSQKDFYYLVEDLPTISQQTQFFKHLMKYMDQFSTTLGSFEKVNVSAKLLSKILNVMIGMSSNPVGQNIILYNDYSKIIPNKTSSILSLDCLMEYIQMFVGQLCKQKVQLNEMHQFVIKLIYKIFFFITNMTIMNKNNKGTYIYNEKRKQALIQLIKIDLKKLSEFSQNIESLSLIYKEHKKPAEQLLKTSVFIASYIGYLRKEENKKEFDKNMDLPDPRELQDRINILEKKREQKFNKEVGFNIFRLNNDNVSKKEQLNQSLYFIEKQLRQMIYDGRISVNTERRFQSSGTLNKEVFSEANFFGGQILTTEYIVNQHRIVNDSIHLRNINELSDTIVSFNSYLQYKKNRNRTENPFNSDPLLNNYNQFTISRLSELTLRNFFFRKLYSVVDNKEKQSNKMFQIFSEHIQQDFQYYKLQQWHNNSIILKRKITTAIPQHTQQCRFSYFSGNLAIKPIVSQQMMGSINPTIGNIGQLQNISSLSISSNQQTNQSSQQQSQGQVNTKMPQIKDFSALMPDPMKFMPQIQQQTRPGSTHVDSFQVQFNINNGGQLGQPKHGQPQLQQQQQQQNPQNMGHQQIHQQSSQQLGQQQSIQQIGQSQQIQQLGQQQQNNQQLGQQQQSGQQQQNNQQIGQPQINQLNQQTNHMIQHPSHLQPQQQIHLNQQVPTNNQSQTQSINQPQQNQLQNHVQAHPHIQQQQGHLQQPQQQQNPQNTIPNYMKQQQFGIPPKPINQIMGQPQQTQQQQQQPQNPSYIPQYRPPLQHQIQPPKRYGGYEQNYQSQQQQPMIDYSGQQQQIQHGISQQQPTSIGQQQSGQQQATNSQVQQQNMNYVEQLTDIERQKIQELKEIQKSNDPRKGMLINRIIQEYPNIIRVLKNFQQRQQKIN